MANGTLLNIYNDLDHDPLGSRSGENFHVPNNYREPDCRVYLVNHSRTRPWRRVKVAVSERRGAEEALIFDKKLASIYNVDTLNQRVAHGYDMNRYISDVRPVAFAFKFGGKTIISVPAVDEQTPAPRIEVPHGVWDLFLGNYERMHGSDLEQQKLEKVWLTKRWKYRHNPVFQYTIDGDITAANFGGQGNPFGFMELVRETQHVGKQEVDREYLTALDIVEV